MGFLEVVIKDVAKSIASGKKELNSKEQLESLIGSSIVVNESVFKFVGYEHPIGQMEYNIQVSDADGRVGKVSNAGNSILELLEYVSENLLDK